MEDDLEVIGPVREYLTKPGPDPAPVCAAGYEAYDLSVLFGRVNVTAFGTAIAAPATDPTSPSPAEDGRHAGGPVDDQPVEAILAMLEPVSAMLDGI